MPKDKEKANMYNLDSDKSLGNFIQTILSQFQTFDSLILHITVIKRVKLNLNNPRQNLIDI
jgi:hypothetical protein